MSLLGACHDRESHVIVSSGFHDPLGPLHPAHVKIDRNQVFNTSLPPFQTGSPPKCGMLAFAVGALRDSLPSRRIKTPWTVFRDGRKNAVHGELATESPRQLESP